MSRARRTLADLAPREAAVTPEAAEAFGRHVAVGAAIDERDDASSSRWEAAQYKRAAQAAAAAERAAMAHQFAMDRDYRLASLAGQIDRLQAQLARRAESVAYFTTGPGVGRAASCLPDILREQAAETDQLAALWARMARA
jgi:hypothetical protein